MGMYNEVFKRCPKCDGLGYMQIHQIVLGFGGFNLDSPESLAEDLDMDQLLELKEAVRSTRWFNCQKCKEPFSINKKDNDIDAKIDIINSICDGDKD